MFIYNYNTKFAQKIKPFHASLVFKRIQKVSMIRKYHNHILQTSPRHHGEEPQNIYNNNTSVRHNNNSKVNSFLFLFKMIAKLQWTECNAYQNKDMHRTSTNNWKYSKQSINNNGTFALERTAAHATGGLKCI